MPENLSPDLLDLRRRTEAFVDQHLLPIRVDQTSDRDARGRIIDAARAAGLHGMTQPKAYGGSEAGPLALTVVRETLAAANHPLSRLAFGPGPGALTGATGLVLDNYLLPMLRGEKRAAFGFTEPRDAERHTSARQDGDTLIINGTKAYVTGGADADFINVLVHMENGERALVVVDRQTPGVTIADRFSSMEGGDHARMEFHDVRVPASHVHGLPGQGMRHALQQIGDTRLLMAADSCGIMLWLDEFIAKHLQTPHPSGTALGQREGVRLRYADMRIDAYVARSTLYRTARLAESGANVMNEVVIAKVYCTEAVGRAVDNAIQLTGGVALTQGHPLEKLLRRVRSMRIAEGASDVLRLNLIKGRLDLNKGTL